MPAPRSRKATSNLPPSVAKALTLAHSNRSKSLWLGGFPELTEIPEEVFALDHLEDIDLSSTGFQTVPERLWDLPNLRSVSLFDCPIESLPNRPGLGIDERTYIRCRTRLDAKNVGELAIKAKALEEGEDFWVDEVKALTSLRSIIIGDWSLDINEEHPKCSPTIWRILDPLADLASLEILWLRGLRLPAVPEGIRRPQAWTTYARPS